MTSGILKFKAPKVSFPFNVTFLYMKLYSGFYVYEAYLVHHLYENYIRPDSHVDP
jgi:hypothetical protein